MSRPSVVHSPRYACDIGAHVFPTAKFALILESLRADGLADPATVVAPEMPDRAILETTHTRQYLDDLEALEWTVRTVPSELPLTAEIVEAYVLAAGGTLLAARKALESGAAAHIGGGFHHA